MLVSHTPYTVSKARVQFVSEANLEKIKALSTQLHGVMDPGNNQFRFDVLLNTFHGFNNDLQEDHFLENYIEFEKYPKASFSGRIVDAINFEKPGRYEVRAKGDFCVHGICINKIIPVQITILNERQLRAQTIFTFNLQEFQIRVPKVVHKKVAENIAIQIDIQMESKPTP